MNKSPVTVKGYVAAVPRLVDARQARVAVMQDDVEYRIVPRGAGVDLDDEVSVPVEVTGLLEEQDAGNSCEKPIATLNFNRAASEFEALRLQTERSGKRPKAFMLTIGNLAMRQARAQFSCNFLACAGYEVIDNLGFPTVEEGVEAAMKAGADIVVICSSDDEYAEYAVPAFKALNGRAMFIVAGAPACMEDLKAAGIENFIHVRVNVLETLKEYNAKLGIK